MTGPNTSNLENIEVVTDLESKLKDESPSAKKIALVDTFGNVSYSLVIGSVLDYCAGLSVSGVIASRASATVMNSFTGGPYGWWREKAFEHTKTTNKSTQFRKTLIDLLAFNTFQIPIYMLALTAGSIVSEGDVNLNKILKGASYLAAISPLIAPTVGWYMDRCRNFFGINSAASGAYNKH